jgi:hypothetical protein
MVKERISELRGDVNENQGKGIRDKWKVESRRL